MDERVEIAASAAYGADWSDASDESRDHFRTDAAAAIAALEVAGYTVARLEQAGWADNDPVDPELWLHERDAHQAWDPERQAYFDNPNAEPVYRIVSGGETE